MITFANTRLRDVPFEVFEAYKDRLPELWRRRAEHYYSEFARTEKGAELWRKGDLEGYGQLVFESGKSSIYSYECGCDELKKLYEIMADTRWWPAVVTSLAPRLQRLCQCEH
ncbi:MAG: hypothetical protein ACLTS6_00545 [Anaerobutyricum sp.]